MLKPMIDLPFQPITWGGSPHDFTEQTAGGIHGLNLGIYTAETTQRYICGTRSMTWDGRVFRYAKVGPEYPITSNKFGAKQANILVAVKVASGVDPNDSPAVTVPNAVVGDTSLVVTFTAGQLGNKECYEKADRTGVLAKNELCGGYISFYTGDYRQQRGIIGNSAVAATGTSMTIYLDAPLDHVLTSGTSTCEILSNPYISLMQISDQNTSVMGMPCVTAAIRNYFWVQTWGILRISGTENVGATQRERQFYFDDQGAVVPSGDYFAGVYGLQHAGFEIERTVQVAYDGAPFIMLQISP